jgi:hypothetical protein
LDLPLEPDTSDEWRRSAWQIQEHEKRRRRRRFTPEFKRDAVEFVRTTGRLIAHIAAELGIYDSTLGARRVRRGGCPYQGVRGCRGPLERRLAAS